MANRQSIIAERWKAAYGPLVTIKESLRELRGRIRDFESRVDSLERTWARVMANAIDDEQAEAALREVFDLEREVAAAGPEIAAAVESLATTATVELGKVRGSWVPPAKPVEPEPEPIDPGGGAR